MQENCWGTRDELRNTEGIVTHIEEEFRQELRFGAACAERKMTGFREEFIEVREEVLAMEEHNMAGDTEAGPGTEGNAEAGTITPGDVERDEGISW